MASRFESSDHSKHFKNILFERLGELQAEKQNKKQLVDHITELNGWLSTDQKKNHLKNINERVNDLKNLGDYGIHLEELRVGIERRYEFMMNEVESKLKTIKDHFGKLIEEAVSEFSNNLNFHKTQNLGNLKDLEKELNATKNKEKKNPPKGIIFDIYTDESLDKFFSFMINFKEEFFALIMSKCVMRNVEEMNEVLVKFKNEYLVDLVQAPKKFPSELFSFFEKTVNEKTVPQLKKSGRVLCGTRPEGEVYAQLNKNADVFKTALPNIKRSPILIPINKSFFAVASADSFKVYVSSSVEAPVKSTFYKNTINPAGSRWRVSEIINGKVPSSTATGPPEICCGAYVRNDNQRELLVFGGDYNVAYCV